MQSSWFTPFKPLETDEDRKQWAESLIFTINDDGTPPYSTPHSFLFLTNILASTYIDNRLKECILQSMERIKMQIVSTGEHVFAESLPAVGLSLQILAMLNDDGLAVQAARTLMVCNMTAIRPLIFKANQSRASLQPSLQPQEVDVGFSHIMRALTQRGKVYNAILTAYDQLFGEKSGNEDNG